MFATHPRQTLLYNLFDIAQARKAPIAVLGCTTRMDVVEMLEKRVKSRFSHRYVYLSLPRSLPAYWEVCKQGLCVDDEDMDVEGIDVGLEGHEAFHANWKAMIEVRLILTVLEGINYLRGHRHYTRRRRSRISCCLTMRHQSRFRLSCRNVFSPLPLSHPHLWTSSSPHKAALSSPSHHQTRSYTSCHHSRSWTWGFSSRRRGWISWRTRIRSTLRWHMMNMVH